MKAESEIAPSQLNAKKNALLFAFPSKEAFVEFKNNDRSISEQSIPAFIRFAYEGGLIKTETEEDFLAFLRNHTSNSVPISFVKTLTFSEVVTTARGKMSVNALIAQLNQYTKKLRMPRLHPSMITNLKKNFKSDSPKKRAALRMIAFWIGLTRSDFLFDYSVLVGLPGSQEMASQLAQSNTGIRIDITFKGHEGVISFEMIDWLKNEISKCVEDLKLYNVAGTEPVFYSTTTATMEFPNPAGRTQDPWLYGQALRGCFAIAHQIPLRWSLSDMNMKHSTTIIAIAAGNFAELGAVMPHLLEKDLMTKHTLRVNEFAHYIARITDIKVIFDDKPTLSALTPNNTIQIWPVKYFWFLYYDIVPDLLAEGMLPANESQYEEFKNEIHFSTGVYSSEGSNKTLSIIRRNPQNHQLIIEVAKVLMIRRMYAEAQSILTIVLSTNPYHLIARIIRIQLTINMGMNQTDYQTFNTFFKQAVEESRFIQENDILSDESWVEIGMMYVSKACYIIKSRRSGKRLSNDDKQNLSVENIFKNLEEAEHCFQKSITYSPNGQRSYFWLIIVRSIKGIIRTNSIVLNPGQSFIDQEEIFSKICLQHLSFLGWSSPSSSSQVPSFNAQKIQSMIKHIQKSTDNTTRAVHFRSYRPRVYYSMAVMLWDLCPILTTGIAMRVLEWLEKARRSAEELTKDNLGAYSIVSWYSEIQNPEHFIQCINQTIVMINDQLKGYSTHKEDHIINKKELIGHKLMMLHFDEIVEQGPLMRNTMA